MRVIAGEVKGFHLKGPPSRATRPMTDKVKGALFSMVGSLGILPNRVLDLYAGTGSLGIEALSRGASWATFVDQSAAAAAVIRANLDHTGYGDVSSIHQTAVAAFIARAHDTPFDLVIIDPPYADPDIIDITQRVGESTLVQSGAFLVVGHSSRVDLPNELGRLRRLRFRRHGDSCFSVYEVADSGGDGRETEATAGADENNTIR